MATYQGTVRGHDILISSPNTSTNHKAAVTIWGTFGRASLYFVPDEGVLGSNRKRPGEDLFEVHYWMYSLPHIVELLRGGRVVHFVYNDSTNVAEIRTSSEPSGDGDA